VAPALFRWPSAPAISREPIAREASRRVIGKAWVGDVVLGVHAYVEGRRGPLGDGGRLEVGPRIVAVALSPGVRACPHLRGCGGDAAVRRAPKIVTRSPGPGRVRTRARVQRYRCSEVPLYLPTEKDRTTRILRSESLRL